MSLPLSDEDVAAIKYISSAHLHQSLTVPATAAHGPLKVTYAVVGSEDRDAPTIIHFGGMFGGRWLVMDMEHAAAKAGVRVVCCDRPGIGGSTPVPLSQRIDVWLETVPVLLERIGAKHVTLVAHSSGTIFLLNTLYHFPQILSPTRPYVGLLAPWVTPDHSKVTLMSVAGYVPGALIANHWNSLCLGMASFFQGKVGPVVAGSSGAISTVTSLFKDDEPVVESSEEARRYLEAYGRPKSIVDKINALRLKYMRVEDSSGCNDEALLCLKKHDVGVWGACENYETFVPDLAKVFSAQQNPSKLKIQAYFAVDDIMIGKGGQKYFNACFSEEACGQHIDYESSTVEGVNHDTIGDPTKGVLEKLYEESKASLASS